MISSRRGLWRWCLAAVAALVTAAGVNAGGDSADAASPAMSAASIPSAELREDFRSLYAGLQQAHYDLYVHTPREDYDRRFQQMLSDLDRPLTPFEAQLRMSIPSTQSSL